jgi:hypothetical protein
MEIPSVLHGLAAADAGVTVVVVVPRWLRSRR